MALMNLRTLLNKFYKFPGFVYGHIELETCHKKQTLVVSVRPRVGAKAICSHCGKPAPIYDTARKARRLQFIPFWGMLVFFEYFMRRVQCPNCGVKTERVPWASSKSPTTDIFAWFIAHWAEKLSWSAVATEFSLSWNRVLACVSMAVTWGRAHMSLEGTIGIGIDEIARSTGHKYVTLVYQIAGGQRRLLYVAKDRTEASLNGFFDWLGDKHSKSIKYVCSDMWKPYLKVIQARVGQALQILDRFHIMSHFSKAINEVRAEEARDLAKKGKGEILKNTRWLLLKRPENLTDRQSDRLSHLVQHNLRSVRAYLLKEKFNEVWTYVSPYWAGKAIHAWTNMAMRSKLEPMKGVAKMIRRHHDLILNWYKAKGEISNGIVEGLNGKGRVITKRAYGFRTYECLKVALYHTLGDLPKPKFTHRFW